MKKINSYKNFYSLLLESHLLVDDQFKRIIQMTRLKSPVSNALFRMFNKDIQTNVNYLSPGKANDEVLFTNDKQVSRIVQSGLDPFEKSRNNSKIGRLVRQLLIANSISMTDKQIEDFVNLYKQEWDALNSPGNFEIVSGDKIRDWYLEARYESGGGSLNGSCMRYPKCQDFFKIYTENPEVCSLVILKSEDGSKLLGRALFWKLDGEEFDFYLDRTYTVKDYDENKMLSWVLSQFPDKKIISYKNNDSLSGVTVSLKNCMFDKYPYMDSILYLNVSEKKLQSTATNRTDLFFQFGDTGGSFTTLNQVFSKKYNKYFPRLEAFYIQSLNDYVPISECVEEVRSLKHNPLYIYKPEAVYSELYKGYITKKDVIETSTWGIVPKWSLVDVVVDDSKNRERIPLAAFGDKYCRAFDDKYSPSFIRTSKAFKDILGVYFTNESKSKLLSAQDMMHRILRMVQVSPKGLQKIGDPEPRKNFFSFGNLMKNTSEEKCQVWGIKESVIPLAVEYSHIKGIYAPLELVKAFNLQPLSSEELYLSMKAMCYDVFDLYPLDISDIQKITKNEEAITLLSSIDTQMSRRSGVYNQNKDFLKIRHISEEERINIFNSTIEKGWLSDRIFKKWIIDFRKSILDPKNSEILNRVLGFFNRKRPFGVNRRYNTLEFIDWFESNIDKVLCNFYIWMVSFDRFSSAKMTASNFRDHTENTLRWLCEFTHTENSLTLGDDIYMLVEEHNHDSEDGHSGRVSRWVRNYLLKSRTSEETYNEEEDAYAVNYPNILPAWDKFKSNNLPNILSNIKKD